MRTEFVQKPRGKCLFRDVIMAGMIVLRWILTCFDLRINDRVCDCDIEHLISINTRNSLTICITASF